MQKMLLETRYISMVDIILLDDFLDCFVTVFLATTHCFFSYRAEYTRSVSFLGVGGKYGLLQWHIHVPSRYHPDS